ncbi:DUF1328 domain-containing protein [Candidatus Pacearchaeota archaeon CG10_big_fil_rev_8_21_14_0_10_32_42]|nr:MAG: DUF1328 domain-containing protein [Candidatus Pacearchaeota archaeon CG10_big_fil_rev_8_21_14_0_10_32_42]
MEITFFIITIIAEILGFELIAGTPVEIVKELSIIFFLISIIPPIIRRV